MLAALAAVLSVETLLVLSATVWTVVELTRNGARIEVDGIAFLICEAIGCLWVGIAAVGAWLGRPWIRGLVITWQLIQLAVGVGAMQGLLAGPLVGVVLLVLGVAGIFLVLTPPVTRVLARDRPGQ